MFTNSRRQEERTGKYGTPRVQYLQVQFVAFINLECVGKFLSWLSTTAATIILTILCRNWWASFRMLLMKVMVPYGTSVLCVLLASWKQVAWGQVLKETSDYVFFHSLVFIKRVLFLKETFDFHSECNSWWKNRLNGLGERNCMSNPSIMLMKCFYGLLVCFK